MALIPSEGTSWKHGRDCNGHTRGNVEAIDGRMTFTRPASAPVVAPPVIALEKMCSGSSAWTTLSLIIRSALASKSCLTVSSNGIVECKQR